MKYTHAATDITHNAAIMECAALRERPSPALINANPPPAKGPIKGKKYRRRSGFPGQVNARHPAYAPSSSLGVRCERITSTSPNTSTPRPASRNKPRGPAAASSAMAVSDQRPTRRQ